MRDLAVTKIWDVKSHLSALVAYVSNTDKTVRLSDEETLQALVRYGVDDLKTEERKFVTVIGCRVEDPAQLMARLNRMSQSKSDTIAYHAYQSFAPGEVDAETAHKIGVQLATELWGNFPVVVATHLDRGHLHNHFALGATAFDYSRYHDCKATYRRLREVSDRLCREYGLSVVPSPTRGNTRHIGEVKAEEEGRPTARAQIRRDMDAVIEHCFTYPQFVRTIQSLGYILEWRGKYLRIRPDSGTRFFRMDKLGKGYTYEDVQERLRENARRHRIIPYAPYEPPKVKPSGLYALYLHYCYLLGALPKKKPANREAYAAIREDVKRARRYSEQAKVLGKYSIDTAEELGAVTERLSGEFKALAIERAKLRNRLRRMHDTEAMQPIKEAISDLSLQMAGLRREMHLCEEVAARCGVIAQVVNTIDLPDTKEAERHNSKSKEKEVTKT